MDETLVLGAVSAASSIFSGYQQKTLADYQAEVAQKQAQINATLTAREAEYNSLLTVFEADAQVQLLDRQLAVLAQNTQLTIDETRRTEAKTIGAQRAAIGASGVALDSGSTADVQRDTMTQAEMEIATIRYSSEIQDQELRTTKQLVAKRGAILASMYNEIGAYKSSATQASGDMSSQYYDMLGSAYMSQGLTKGAGTLLGDVLTSQTKGGKASG